MNMKKLKQNASAYLIQYSVKIREGSLEGIRKTMEERICERDEFQIWSDRPRDWQMVRGGDCDEMMCRMRWTSRRVNRIMLTEYVNA